MATRWLWGDTAPVNAPDATAKAVAVGDVVGLAANTLVLASDTTWDTDTATTQTAFAALFLGISGQAKTITQDKPFGNTVANQIRVDTNGIWELELLTAAAQRDLAQLDEKLYLDVFAQPDLPAQRRAGAGR